ncbi:MAG: hypothetical protein AAB609_02465 [Patescibacteria group bacterium]
MITIIHGDATNESREYFLKIRTTFQNLLSLEGQNITADVLINFFSGGNLFFEEKNLAIENLLSKNKAGKNLDGLVAILNEHEGKSNIIMWEEKEVSQKNLSLFPKASIQIFKIPKLIFNFLDNLKPGNGENLILIFQKLLENTPVEIILYMMVRQLRFLIAVSSSDKSDTIEELGKMAPWQKGKLERQAVFFGQGRLINLYDKLYNIDLSGKTGALSMPLADAIDFLLLDI